MTFTLDIAVIVPIVLAVIGGFSTLLWMIRRGDLQRITKLEDLMNQLPSLIRSLGEVKGQIVSTEKMQKFLEDLHADLETTKKELAKEKERGAVSAKSITYLEDNVDRIVNAVEKMREELNDAVVTINGFGRDFLTRKEFYEQQKRPASGGGKR